MRAPVIYTAIIMPTTTITIKNGTFTLPKGIQKSWQEETKAFIETLDPETVIIRKFKAEQTEPDYDIDDAIWKVIKKDTRAIRKKLFQEQYPELYAKLRKKKS